jgi:hypothetical protein
MNGQPDWRHTVPPHCYRVVQLGLSLRTATARPLAERAAADITVDGKTTRASSLFEPKVGGGGHLLLVNEETGATWARLLVEPDGPVLSLAAAILDVEWEESDDTVVARVRAWITALHGATVGPIESGGNGSSSGEISGAGR